MVILCFHVLMVLYPNRIVTLIVYLNDVTEGGATVFPKLNLRFQPKKGTGLIFYAFRIT